MLPRENRLHHDKDFKKVFQKGRRAGNQNINLNLLSNRLSVTRVGIVVGKKFSKKAVERNRAKRLYREAVRLCYSKIKPGYDIVIFLKPNNKAGKLKLEEIRGELEALLKREGVI